MIRRAILFVSNAFMILCLVSLSLVAVFTEEPKTRPPFVRMLGMAGLASLLLYVSSRLWPYLTRRRSLTSRDTGGGISRWQ